MDCDNLSDSMEKDAKRDRKREFIVVSVMLVLLAATIGIVVWQTDKLLDDKPGQPSTTAIPRHETWPKYVDKLNLAADMTLTIKYQNKIYLNAILNSPGGAQNVKQCTGVSSEDLCIEWPDARLKIGFQNFTVPGLSKELECYDMEWKALRCASQVITDCFNVSTSHWYGGYADHTQNWPFERNNRTLSAYVVNDSYIGEIGGVIERYFFSASGVGIFVDHDIPMYFSLNHPKQGLMCITAKYEKYPYFNPESTLPTLRYKVCLGDNVLDIHQKMSAVFIDRPYGIPDKNLFRYPIWSTWAQYKKDVNQTTVLDFAHNILEHNFTHAQLEIDDDWTPKYGDMVFNVNKFPNATQMVKDLNELGFRVTVWVHPFFNFDSSSFFYTASNFMLARQFEGLAPVISPWWDGKLAGILDVTNASAVAWYLDQLQHLKDAYNISSFKFDAGETSWLPHIYSVANMSLNPTDMYPRKWVELAADADKTFHQEVRVGYKTQKYPIFVRMMDKFSDWSHENALKTIIPCVLTYGLLGYPFVLPDMIGGNGYDGTYPDPELFIRWLQLNTFLPSMQYSIVPWSYNETIISITRKFTELHERYSDTLLIKYAEIARDTGAPIIRPLWWLSPDDEDALTCENEFLVGEEYLVAPILDKGARLRDIYFPAGTWRDQIHNISVLYTGPAWVRNYPVSLDELAYFEKVQD